MPLNQHYITWDAGSQLPSSSHGGCGALPSSLGVTFLSSLFHGLCVGGFSLSIFASKKRLGVMGVGWILPALLCEVKGSIRRKDICCLLAACMTPEIPKQYA